MNAYYSHNNPCHPIDIYMFGATTYKLYFQPFTSLPILIFGNCGSSAVEPVLKVAVFQTAVINPWVDLEKKASSNQRRFQHLSKPLSKREKK